MMICVTDLLEKLVGKGENAGYQHFLHFPQCFQKASFEVLLKVGIVWLRVKVISQHDLSDPSDKSKCKHSMTKIAYQGFFNACI